MALNASDVSAGDDILAAHNNALIDDMEQHTHDGVDTALAKTHGTMQAVVSGFKTGALADVINYSGKGHLIAMAVAHSAGTGGTLLVKIIVDGQTVLELNQDPGDTNTWVLTSPFSGAAAAPGSEGSWFDIGAGGPEQTLAGGFINLEYATSLQIQVGSSANNTFYRIWYTKVT